MKVQLSRTAKTKLEMLSDEDQVSIHMFLFHLRSGDLVIRVNLSESKAVKINNDLIARFKQSEDGIVLIDLYKRALLKNLFGAEQEDKGAE